MFDALNQTRTLATDLYENTLAVVQDDGTPEQIEEFSALKNSSIKPALDGLERLNTVTNCESIQSIFFIFLVSAISFLANFCNFLSIN